MKAKQWISIFLLAACLCAFAVAGMAAGRLVLPENLTEIKAEAFEGNTSLDEVVLPEGIETIGSRAFADSSIASINLPSSITYIAEDAFVGCGDISIDAELGTYAYGWAWSNDLLYLEETPVSSFEYTIADGKVTIEDYVGELTEVVIPSKIEGYPVTSIGSHAFRYCSSLTSVMIPDGVTSIYQYAFEECSSLMSIILPDGVTHIDRYAFCDCSSLKSIAIPDSVTSIGNGAFQNCSSLASILLPSGLTRINSYAFCDCSSLTSITIPDGVTTIGQYAFDDCSSMTSVEIPGGVTIIDQRAFRNCSSLTSITLPDSITTIGNDAFYLCSSLTDVYAQSVESWMKIDFRNYSSNPMTCADRFYVDDKLVTSITIPDSVTSIGNYVFSDFTSLMNITIPDSVTSIGTSAFVNCSGLTNIIIPDSVTIIGDVAFAYCSNLTNITIPENVTSIGDYAFQDCTNLMSITMLNDAMSIDGDAFYNCKNLTDVYVKSIESWLSIDFYESRSNPMLYADNLYINDKLVTSITIPDGTTSIGDFAFLNCNSLVSITIPDSVTSIGDMAFCNCGSLTSINIPDGVVSIGDSAFGACNALTSINMSDSVTSIGDSAFGGCINLTNIKLSKNITSIGRYTFDSCERLRSIVIPDGVISIDYCAFLNCKSLIRITIPDSVTSIGGSAFFNCSSLMSISIPESVTSIDSSTFGYGSNITIYGVSGSYAETYAAQNDITFVAGEMPNVFATISDFTLNSISTEITVTVGGQLVFGGTVNAGSAPLTAVQASIFDAADPTKGVECARVEDLGADSFDLSTFSPIKVGETYVGEEQSLTMEAGKDYIVMIYAADEAGNGFVDHDPDIEGPQGPSILVHVVDPGEHEHMPSTTEAATYLFHVFESIDGDNQNHNVAAIMWDVTCAVCGEVYMYKDELGYEGDYVPRIEKHTYSEDGYCTACGYVCAHNFVDIGEEKKYTGIWKDCGDGTHERLSLMKYYECTDCGMRELRRVVEEGFIPEAHQLDAEERYISVEKLPDDDSKRVLQHQVTVEKWEYCETRAYGCTYRKLLSTETRNVEHRFVDGVCECGYVQEVIGSREELLEGVNWELVYYVEHIIEDDTQFASAIGNLFNRGVDEVMGYLWNIANFDVFGLAEHIWEDVNYAYREEAAMSIIESLAGYGYSEKDLADAFYLLAIAIDLGADISDITFDSVEKILKKWDPNGVEAEAQNVFDKIGVMNSVNGLLSDVIKDASLNANQRATLMLLLSDYDVNYAYLFKERRSAEINNDDELYAIYDIALTKLEEVYKDRAKVYIANPVEYLSFDTFISGVELALEIKGIDSPIEYGLGKLSAKTGGTETLAKGAKVALIVHTCVSFVAGEALGGNDIYDAQQKMYDNLTVLEPMQKQLLSAKQTYINDPSETNMNTLVKRAVSVANYKQKTLDNVWQYRDAQWFTSVSESSINKEKSNLAIYAEGVTAINNGQMYEPINAVPAANGVKHGEMCPVCALK